MMEFKTTFEELKFDDDDWRVTGYGSVFNSVDKVGDTILPGAFEKTLANGNPIKMHLEHVPWITPGKWDKAAEDEKGLRMLGHLTRDHSVAMDLRASFRHGTVKGMSIGFTIPRGGFKRREDGGRDIKAIELFEVSFTHSPAEPKATIESFKSEVQSLQSLGDVELFLRESGNYSRSMATVLLGQIKSLCLSESDTGATNTHMEAAYLKSVLDRYSLQNLTWK